MTNMAGLASMTFRKKEKLYSMLETAMVDFDPRHIPGERMQIDERIVQYDI